MRIPAELIWQTRIRQKWIARWRRIHVTCLVSGDLQGEDPWPSCNGRWRSPAFNCWRPRGSCVAASICYCDAKAYSLLAWRPCTKFEWNHCEISRSGAWHNQKRRRYVAKTFVQIRGHIIQLNSLRLASRHVSATDYNARSSRSHTLFQMVGEWEIVPSHILIFAIPRRQLKADGNILTSVKWKYHNWSGLWNFQCKRFHAKADMPCCRIWLTWQDPRKQRLT